MPTTTDTTYTWPTPTKQLLATYLKERTSAAADAPHQGLPFITEAGVLRVKPSDWLAWLEGQGIAAPKRAALQALKDAGLVQRVYPLPKHPDHPEAKSFGLYTGKATPAMSTLPRRQGAAPKVAAAKAAKPEAGSGGVARVEASTLQVGDVIGTTRTDSRKTIESGTGTTIVRITQGGGARVQARDEHGKVIRSFAPDTKVWRGRTVA